MSALTAPLSAPGRATAPSPRHAPRPMEVVPTVEQRRSRPKSVYAAVSTAGVFAILLAQLLLSIALSEGAYRISALQSVAIELDRNAQVLTESLDTLRSPQNLAANAESLGMVANASPAYLRLADATVLGAPVAAGAGAGVLDGRDSMIGNVLLADVPLVTPTSTGEASGVSAEPSASGSVASGSTAQSGRGAPMASVSGAAPAALPSPVTR